MQKIVQGTAPEKFTSEHLKSIGFGSSSDRAIIPMLKDLGFLSADGVPTQVYLDYRDSSRSKIVMASALREAYGDVFHVAEKPTDNDRPAIMGKFKSAQNSSDRVAELQAMTFLAFLKLADLSAAAPRIHAPVISLPDGRNQGNEVVPPSTSGFNLRYNIEIHLPATKDPEVFNAIFKSLKSHLLG
jgi:hypothetical protein